MKTRCKAIVAAITIWFAVAPSAFAQALPFDWENEVADRNDDLSRCMHRDRANAEQTIRSCGRVIADRNSSAHTGAAYYSRGLMRQVLRDQEGGQEDLNNAYRFFTIAIGASDRHTDAYRNRAAALYRLGRYQEAAADYVSALAVVTNARDAAGTRVRSGVADLRSNQVASLHYRLGGVYFRMGDWSAALGAFEQASQLAPDARIYRGAICEARAAAHLEPGATGSLCQEVVANSAGDDKALFSLAFSHFSQANYVEAFVAFSRAYRLNPQNHLAQYGRGVSALQLGNTSDGGADVAQATQQLDDTAIAYYANAGLRGPQ